MTIRAVVGAAVAAASVQLFLFAPQHANACSCFDVKTLCEYVDSADVVIRATAAQRIVNETNIHADVIYDVDVATFFKTEPNVRYANEITFATGAYSALCGIYLEIGQEYFLDLYRDGEGELRSVGLCGASRLWSSLTTEDTTILEEGCPATADLCDESCGEFQECLLYTEDSSYYCADVCDPSPCDAHEECALDEVLCIQAPCPPVATCTAP